ncbi:MAG: hypothetical protein OEY79_00880 [Anaplasmataceae bacterium]|nr:hypothetical protein [Anaplasmataceae bacterium]
MLLEDWITHQSADYLEKIGDIDGENGKLGDYLNCLTKEGHDIIAFNVSKIVVLDQDGYDYVSNSGHNVFFDKTNQNFILIDDGIDDFHDSHDSSYDIINDDRYDFQDSSFECSYEISSIDKLAQGLVYEGISHFDFVINVPFTIADQFNLSDGEDSDADYYITGGFHYGIFNSDITRDINIIDEVQELSGQYRAFIFATEIN